MLAVVKTPRTEVRITGYIPFDILEALRREYGKKLKLAREKADDAVVNVFETEEYKEFKKRMKPGDYMRLYRRNRGITQTDLGRKLSLSRAYICDMEKGRRAVSKVLARKMAAIFNTSVSRFI